MPGLYVHIPFCARRCPYCDFAVSVDRRPAFRAQYLAALFQDLAAVLAATPVEASAGRPRVDTVFVGGGTPTELPAQELGELLAAIRKLADLAPDAEISLEANPEHLTPAYLRDLYGAGFNRISLGAQSLSAADLQALGRQHTPEQVVQVVCDARAAGFENISLDLIYAVPGQTPASWERTLAAVAGLRVPHVSAYSLTVESGTEFGRRLRQGQLTLVSDDSQAEYMEAAGRILAPAGLQRYEVSNYARPGYECRHNLNYWAGGNYFAAGSGAHGHLDGHRYWNERSAPHFVRRMQNEGTGRAGEEFLTPRQRLEEIVAMGLRCAGGFDLGAVGKRLHMDARAELNGRLEAAGRLGLIQLAGEQVRPLPEKLALADAVAGHILA